MSWHIYILVFPNSSFRILQLKNCDALQSTSFFDFTMGQHPLDFTDLNKTRHKLSSIPNFSLIMDSS